MDLPSLTRLVRVIAWKCLAHYNMLFDYTSDKCSHTYTSQDPFDISAFILSMFTLLFGLPGKRHCILRYRQYLIPSLEMVCTPKHSSMQIQDLTQKHPRVLVWEEEKAPKSVWVGSSISIVCSQARCKSP